MRKHGRRDANQAPLVAVARQFGASWLDMADLGDDKPDGLLGLHGTTFLVEFKTAKGALSAGQAEFIATWRGSPVHVIRDEAELVRLLGTVLPKKRIHPTHWQDCPTAPLKQRGKKR